MELFEEGREEQDDATWLEQVVHATRAIEWPRDVLENKIVEDHVEGPTEFPHHRRLCQGAQVTTHHASVPVDLDWREQRRKTTTCWRTATEGYACCPTANTRIPSARGQPRS